MFAYAPPIREHVDPDPNAAAAEQLRQVVAEEHPYPAGRFAGRGIVMCAGGARVLTCAWVAISVLRRVVDCRLPIQLWHIGPRELGELEAAMFSELEWRSSMRSRSAGRGRRARSAAGS